MFTGTKSQLWDTLNKMEDFKVKWIERSFAISSIYTLAFAFLNILISKVRLFAKAVFETITYPIRFTFGLYRFKEELKEFLEKNDDDLHSVSFKIKLLSGDYLFLIPIFQGNVKSIAQLSTEVKKKYFSISFNEDLVCQM